MLLKSAQLATLIVSTSMVATLAIASEYEINAKEDQIQYSVSGPPEVMDFFVECYRQRYFGKIDPQCDDKDYAKGGLYEPGAISKYCTGPFKKDPKDYYPVFFLFVCKANSQSAGEVGLLYFLTQQTHKWARPSGSDLLMNSVGLPKQ
jgi:hypothetical protein